jgi:nucleotide-binding universal stress UspA family protein
MEEERGMNEQRVVVGVDGSVAARAALEFALEEAARRAAPLRVVAAVALPEFWASYYGELVPPPPSDIVGEARKQTQRFVDEVVAERGDAVRGLSIGVEVRAGRPGEVLVDAARGAAVLVVGHRGRGSASSVLLGSVGLQCVLHATCPVTVVRPKPEAVRADEPVRASWAPAPA